MPRTPTTPKPPRRPAWSIWQHKIDRWIHFGQKWLKFQPEDFEEHDPTHFRFTTTLRYVSCSIGRSTVNFQFKDLEHGGPQLTLLPREFDRILTHTTLHEGMLRGIWRFEKHGTTIAAYLVKELVDEDDDAEQSI